MINNLKNNNDDDDRILKCIKNCKYRKVNSIYIIVRRIKKINQFNHNNK